MEGVTVACSAIKNPSVVVKPEPAGVTIYLQDTAKQQHWGMVVIPLAQLREILHQCDPDLQAWPPEVPDVAPEVPEVPDVAPEVPEVPDVAPEPEYDPTASKKKKRRG